MAMTTKPRGNSGSGKPKPAQGADHNGNPPRSEVFRMSSEEQRWAQRRWPETWTIAEQFIREGYYYRLLRRPVEVKHTSPELTKREHEVLRLACVGHTNKGIAHSLNVSASTVGVLLFRAAAKLNVSSRSDLLSAYKRMALASTPDEPLTNRRSKR
jgi:DNA-binding CsgD family transcriptional regulator